ncbi:hypothetical protein PGTUg99_014917 [Puccinia graminis f. sp. tritici]|uniref:DH domain-containing protein n=2 Tax=Puccinia graminis f. sp. tritici TaxID=56615 RepID=A0A5B0M386_PUCGR|nr:hypothetical protein PGTUg99_014917 [Puccinia graminis f. sp. tritici]
MSVSLNYHQSNLQHQFSTPTNKTSLIYQTNNNCNSNPNSMKPSPSSSSSSTPPSNLLTVPETKALLISPSPPTRPPRNPWRSSYQPHPILTSNQTAHGNHNHNHNNNNNNNAQPATATTSSTSTSKHRTQPSSSSLLSILEHPSDPSRHCRHPSQSTSSDPRPTRLTNHMSSSPGSSSYQAHKSHRRHSSVISAFNSPQPIIPSASPRRPISFHQQISLAPPSTTATARSSPGSITKLLTRKLSFLSSRKAHVPPTSPSGLASIAPPQSPNPITPSSPAPQTAHNPGDDSEEAEFTSADEGDENFWKHLRVPSPPRHSSPHPASLHSTSRSTISHTEPIPTPPTRLDNPPLTRQYRIKYSDLQPCSQTHTSPSDEAKPQITSNRNSTYQSSIRLTSPTRHREPTTKKIPAEFRAGRVFVRSSQIFTEPIALSSSDPSAASVEESEQDHSSSSSNKPNTPSSYPNQPATSPIIYPSILSSSPTEDEDHSLTKDCGILSRISEPFNALLSAPNTCLYPRRSPSSYSLAHRFNSGVHNNRSSPKSNSNGDTNQDGLLQATPTPKLPPVKKSISMTFNLRHVPKFLNQRAKSDHVTDGEKVASYPKPSEVQIVMANLSPPGLNDLSPTWRSLVSPDEFLRLEQRFGAVEMKRQELIWELCRTELGYVDSLKMIITTFFQPLKKTQPITLNEKSASQTWSGIVPELITNLFENLEEICNLHQEICESIVENQAAHQIPDQLLILDDQLQTANEEDHTVILRISETFQNYVDRFKIYQNYLIRFESVHQLIDQLTKDPNSRFGAFIRARSQLEECGKMSFNSFLLKPVQRLMKYPLFFKQLCDVTPALHPDHLAGQQLWKSTDQTIREMQHAKVHEEELAFLKSIESQIVGLSGSFKLVNGKRKLVRQGFVRRVHDISYLAQKQQLESDDDTHHSRKPLRANSPRRTTISSSSSSRSSLTAVDKRLRSRSQLSDDWSLSDHVGFRSSMKSAFSSPGSNLLSDGHSSSQRLSKSSYTSLKTSVVHQENPPSRFESQRQRHVPLPARPGQQVSPSLPALSPPLGSSKIISRPKQLAPSSSSKTKVPKPKMSLNPKSSLKSNEIKVDQLPIHHSSDKRQGRISDPVDPNLKTKPSSSSLSLSSRDRRQGKSAKEVKTSGRPKAVEPLGLEQEDPKSQGQEESLYLFMFSDGLLLLTRPIADPREQPLKPSHTVKPQLFRLVAEPLALSSLLGFCVLPSDLLSHRQCTVQQRSSTNDGHCPKPEPRRLEFEKESKETKGWTSGSEGGAKRGRRGRAKTGPEPSRMASPGRVELQLRPVDHSEGDDGLMDQEILTLTLGLPGPLPASITPSVYYALALDQPKNVTNTTLKVSNALNVHNVHDPVNTNDAQKLSHDFMHIDPSVGLVSLAQSELIHSLTLILFP